ncbi:MAG: hypothetical protein QOI41_829 [Myxococcales bacterium]|nr:hypothetical protein [Myxococcales bacterium]
MKLVRGRAVARLGGATVASLALLAACSLTTSLDGFTGGADDAGIASDSAGEAGPTGEAGPLPEGSTGNDAGIDAEAGPAVPYCDSLVPKPTFCDDFERPNSDVVGSWGVRSLSGGGVVTIGPSTRTATGSELEASIPVFDAGSVSQAALDRTFTGLVQKATLSYALRIEAAPGQGSQQLMVVSVAPPASGGDFFQTYLFVMPSGVILVEQTFPNGGTGGGNFVQNPLTVPIVFGKWQRIEMTVTLTAPASILLTVDGVVAFNGVADPAYKPGQVVVDNGIHYTNTPSGPLSVHIDDLFVDLK